MADLSRIKRNVAKMSSLNAPIEDIDGYISSEGVTIDDVRNFKEQDTMAKFRESPNPILRGGQGVFDKVMPQWLTGAPTDKGQKTIWGDVGERIPGAIRNVATQEKPLSQVNIPQLLKSGFQKPESVPGYAETLYGKGNTGRGGVDALKAGISTAVGTGLDVATNPFTYMGGVGKGKVGQEVGKAGNLVKGMAQQVVTSPFGQATGRGIKEVIKTGKSTISNLPSKLPKKMGKDWLLKQPKKVKEIVDNTEGGIKKELSDFYNSEIGDIPSDMKRLEGNVNKLYGAAKEESQELITKITEAFPDGVIQPTVKDTKKLKDLVQDYIPESTWMKGKKGYSVTPNQQKLVDVYFDLKDTIHESLAKAGGEEAQYLSYLEKKATDVFRLGKVMKRMVIDETGEPTKTSGIINAMSDKPAQAGRKQMFERLSEFDSSAKQVIKDMEKFHKRQVIKGVGKKIAGAGLATGGGIIIGKKIFGK